MLIDTNLGGGSQKLYVRRNKIISESNIDTATQKLVLEKAVRFQKAYKKAN